MAVHYGSGVQRITIAGVAASVRHGSRLAADLGAWHVDGGWLVAEVKTLDPFRITQAPLVLAIPNASGAPTMRPLADVSIMGGQLTARLLPKGSV